MANIAQLEAVLAQIEFDPEHWNQGSWRAQMHNAIPRRSLDEVGREVLEPDCDTAFCFAGWAVHLDGAKWTDNDDTLWANEDDLDQDVLGAACYCGNHGETVLVRDRAKRLLGLDLSEANYLFNPHRTLADIRFFIDALKESRDMEVYMTAAAYRELHDFDLSFNYPRELEPAF